MGYDAENSMFSPPPKAELESSTNPVSIAGKHQLIEAVQNTNKELSDEEQRFMEFLTSDN